jgi:hypothetical protein
MFYGVENKLVVENFEKYKNCNDWLFNNNDRLKEFVTEISKKY